MILVPKEFTPKQIKCIKNYKYCCTDNSILNNFGMRPIWEKWAQSLSKSLPFISPNMVTIIGYMFMLCYHLLDCYYNPGTNKQENLPKWAYLIAGCFHIIGYWFDAIDGKLARITYQSSFVGELFDHTIDSLAHFQVALFGASAFVGNQIVSPYSKMAIALAPTIAMNVLMIQKLFQGSLIFAATTEPQHYIFMVVCFYLGLVETPNVTFLYYATVVTIFIGYLDNTLKVLYQLSSKYGFTPVFSTFSPFLVNYILFLIWQISSNILGLAHSNITVRYFLTALQMKNACLIYRNILAQTVDLKIALWDKKLLIFYTDLILGIVATAKFPEFTEEIAMILAIFSIFQFVYGLSSLCLQICKILEINFLKVTYKKRGQD